MRNLLFACGCSCCGHIRTIDAYSVTSNSEELAMCGYRCDLCKAYVHNINKLDEREELNKVWKNYYDLDISA